MTVTDVLVLAVILAVLSFALWCIWRAKKNGKKCIGCPDSCACSKGNCAGGCNGCAN